MCSEIGPSGSTVRPTPTSRVNAPLLSHVNPTAATPPAAAVPIKERITRLRPVVRSATGSGHRLLARDEVVHPADAAIANRVHHVDLAVERRPRDFAEARAGQSDNDPVAGVDHLQVIDT